MKKALTHFFGHLGNSYLFTEATSGKRTLHWAIIPLVFFGLAVLGITLGALAEVGLGNAGKAAEGGEGTFKGVSVLFTLFGPAILMLALWVYFYEGRAIRSLGFSRRGGTKRFFTGMAIGVSMMSIVVLINWAAGGYALNTAALSLTSPELIAGIAFLLVGFTVQAGAEELYLRGWLMPVIGARYPRVIAILLPAFAFVALHGNPEGRPFYTAFGLLFFTLIVTLWSLRDGSIAAAAGWHAGWNWASGHLFGLNISNTSFGDKSLLDFEPAGSVYTSGGTGGPEWTVAATALLLIALLWLIRDIYKSGVYQRPT